MIHSVWYAMIQVIVPISVPVLAGVLLVRFRGLEPTHLLNVVFYFLLPALIFTNLYATQLSFTELVNIAIFFLLNSFFLWLTALVVGIAFRLPNPERAGLTLVATLTNSANYGLPLILLAFGQIGMEKASVYVIIQIIFSNTMGVYFAARSNSSVKPAIGAIFKLPAIYAAALAVLLRLTGFHLPVGLETGVSMAALAHPPVMLVVLGTQMARINRNALEKEHKITFWSGMGIRTLLSPLLAFLALYILGIDGMFFSVLLILASMPVAVNAGLLAEKFGASPNIVSKCILWTTLASFIVLPILISLTTSST